ncbi:HU family DNA-binding protein [Bathymodiolus heckerae thiotrophic gill symbiont]|uniref:HU family DNA-binding protein n=1 Tax=Bathymodiolus heckerae thiotrophic gill symbiont TaxID=1052212 RepID=UPI0020182311|nr:HU family DNA-binding protein [Bathymodiolus heckerae thiotrophic gill symbiont]
MSQISGLTKADAARALSAMTGVITSAMANSDSVQLTGFGTFLVRDRAARTGRNPQTGEALQIKASRVVGFKAGKVLKEAVNG